MSKRTTFIVLGIIIAIMPLLGFPGSLKDIFYHLLGGAVVLFAYFSDILYCKNCEKFTHSKNDNTEPEHVAETGNSPYIAKENTNNRTQSGQKNFDIVANSGKKTNNGK